MRRLLLLLALLCGIAYAYDPCRDPNFELCYAACCGAFEGGGELLYMRPTVCGLNFLIEDQRTAGEIVADSLPIGVQKAINPGYSVGFRLWIGYLFEDGTHDVRAQYTGLHHADKTGVVPQDERVIWPTFGHPAVFNIPLWTANSTLAAAQCRVRLDYDAFDAQLGRWRSDRCERVLIHTAIGLHYANIERHMRAHYNGFSNQLSQVNPPEGTFDGIYDAKRKVWAIGPVAGVEGLYRTRCGFGIGGRAATGILGGRTWANHHLESTQITAAPTAAEARANMRLHKNSHGILTPMFNFRGGINYTWYCEEAFLLVAEFGYEFLTYIHVLSTLTFNHTEGTCQTSCENFGLHGFYLSARLQF